MRKLFAVLFVVLASSTAHAATGMLNLYLQSAAAWERCTGNTITPEQAANLSLLIARHTLETVSAEGLLSEIQKARQNTPAGCELPLVKVDRDYFEQFILPRINVAAEVHDIQSPDTRVAGR